jgi:hypothetical protein
LSLRLMPSTRELESELLVGLGQHRTLSTRHVRAMYVPGCAPRRTQKLMASLEDRRLVARARHRLSDGVLLWYLTDHGAALLDPLDVPGPLKLLSARQVEGPLQMHTLAVNDVGLAFMEAARERSAVGDICGPLAWRHEVWHWLDVPNGRSRGRGTRADALLQYTTTQPLVKVHRAFVEVDRDSVEPQELAAQLGRYGRLCGAAGSWRPQYGEFPRILVVFASHERASRERMKMRMATVAALARGDAALTARSTAGEVRIYFTLLEHLQSYGPFGKIWARLDAPDRLVGWLDDEPA